MNDVRLSHHRDRASNTPPTVVDTSSAYGAKPLIAVIDVQFRGYQDQIVHMRMSNVSEICSD